MLARLHMAVLALGLVLSASGVTGTIAYLCAMGGEARTSGCCCSEHASEPVDRDCFEAAGGDACCQVEISGSSHSPAIVPLERGVAQVMLLPALPPAAMLQLEPPAPEIVWAPRSGGPLQRSGPALFVRHCSYLI